MQATELTLWVQETLAKAERIKAVAKAVAAEMPGWTGDVGRDADGEPMRQGVIKHADGTEIDLSLDSYQHRGRLLLACYVKTDYPGRPGHHGIRTRHEITVAPDTPPAKVAKQIASRLLPDYRIANAAMLERAATAKAWKDNTEANQRAIADALGSKPPREHDQGMIYWSLEDRASGTAEVNGDSATLKLSLTVKDALAVCAFLRKL